MKRILLTWTCMLAGMICLAQSDWNYIGSPTGLNFRERTYVTYSTEKVCYYIPTYDLETVASNDLMDDDWTFYHDKKKQDGYRTICMPTPIYEEYKLGTTCMKTGIIIISIGGVCALAGACCFAGAAHANNPQPARTAGTVLTAVGGGVIGLSIPLFCWGDFFKRDANWKLQLVEKRQ